MDDGGWKEVIPRLAQRAEALERSIAFAKITCYAADAAHRLRTQLSLRGLGVLRQPRDDTRACFYLPFSIPRTLESDGQLPKDQRHEKIAFLFLICALALGGCKSTGGKDKNKNRT